jgi:hypothetical protein
MGVVLILSINYFATVLARPKLPTESSRRTGVILIGLTLCINTTQTILDLVRGWNVSERCQFSSPTVLIVRIRESDVRNPLLIPKHISPPNSHILPLPLPWLIPSPSHPVVPPTPGNSIYPIPLCNFMAQTGKSGHTMGFQHHTRIVQ